MSLRLRILHVAIVLHAAGAAFAVFQFLVFPETDVDLIPETVALADARHVLALMAVLPTTFVAWDIVFLQGLRRGSKRALLVGFISGGAGLMGALIHLGFGRWGLFAADGIMGATYLGLTWWNWGGWKDRVA